MPKERKRQFCRKKQAFKERLSEIKRRDCVNNTSGLLYLMDICSMMNLCREDFTFQMEISLWVHSRMEGWTKGPTSVLRISCKSQEQASWMESSQAYHHLWSGHTKKKRALTKVLYARISHMGRELSRTVTKLQKVIGSWESFKWANSVITTQAQRWTTSTSTQMWLLHKKLYLKLIQLRIIKRSTNKLLTKIPNHKVLIPLELKLKISRKIQARWVNKIHLNFLR